MRRARVDATNPVDWRHPITTGAAQWLLGLPGRSGGATWPDATGRTTGATVAAGAVWVAGPDGFTEVQVSGGNAVGLSIPYVGGVAGVTYGDSWSLSWWFTPLLYPVLYTAIIDDAGRSFSSFYNTSGTSSYLSDYGAMLVGGRYRLTLAYVSTGTTSVGPLRAYRDGRFVSSRTPASPFWTSPLAVSLGGNPSGSATPGFPTARYGAIMFRRHAPAGPTSDADRVAFLDADQARRGFPDAVRRAPRAWHAGGSAAFNPARARRSNLFLGPGVLAC